MATEHTTFSFGSSAPHAAQPPHGRTTAADLVDARRFLSLADLLDRLAGVRGSYLTSPPPWPPDLSSLVVTPTASNGWAFAIDDGVARAGAAPLRAPGSTGPALAAEHVWHVAAIVYLLLAAGTRSPLKLSLLQHRLQMGSAPSILEYRDDVPRWAAHALALALSARPTRRPVDVEALFAGLEAPERTDTLAGVRVDPAVFAEALRTVEEAPAPPAASPEVPEAPASCPPSAPEEAPTTRRPFELYALWGAVGVVVVLAMGIAIGRSVGPWRSASTAPVRVAVSALAAPSQPAAPAPTPTPAPAPVPASAPAVTAHAPAARRPHPRPPCAVRRPATPERAVVRRPAGPSGAFGRSSPAVPPTTNEEFIRLFGRGPQRPRS